MELALLFRQDIHRSGSNKEIEVLKIIQEDPRRVSIPARAVINLSAFTALD